MSQSERLQELWDDLGLMDATIVYKPRKGWYAMPDEARHFHDQGEYLGYTFEAARNSINYLKARP